MLSDSHIRRHYDRLLGNRRRWRIVLDDGCGFVGYPSTSPMVNPFEPEFTFFNGEVSFRAPLHRLREAEPLEPPFFYQAGSGVTATGLSLPDAALQLVAFRRAGLPLARAWTELSRALEASGRNVDAAVAAEVAAEKAAGDGRRPIPEEAVDVTPPRT